MNAVTDDVATQRLDAWLWHARVLATRAACARLVTEAGIRINGRRVEKPAARVMRGDVLTFAVGQRIRTLQVVGCARRRMGPQMAIALYQDLSPEG